MSCMRFGPLVRKGHRGAVCWLRGRDVCLAEKKKPKPPRKKAREGVMKLIKAELVEDKKKGVLDRKNQERSKRIPSGANVRVRVGNINSGDKIEFCETDGQFERYI